MSLPQRNCFLSQENYLSGLDTELLLKYLWQKIKGRSKTDPSKVVQSTIDQELLPTAFGL